MVADSWAHGRRAVGEAVTAFGALNVLADDAGIIKHKLIEGRSREGSPR